MKKCSTEIKMPDETSGETWTSRTRSISAFSELRCISASSKTKRAVSVSTLKKNHNKETLVSLEPRCHTSARASACFRAEFSTCSRIEAEELVTSVWRTKERPNKHQASSFNSAAGYQENRESRDFSEKWAFSLPASAKLLELAGIGGGGGRTYAAPRFVALLLR